MKSKKIMSGLLAILALSTASCKRNDNNGSNGSNSSNKVELNMSVYYNNDDTHMKFTAGKYVPYEAPNGNTYNAGDFKPVWQTLQSKLNFKINDVSPTGKVEIKDNFTTLITNKFQVNGQQVNVAQGNSDQIIAEGTNNNTLVDLSQYLDKMPDFKKFLDENPTVKKTISNKDGKIFYAPYFDGYDDIERMMMLRSDWVEKLLDQDNVTGDIDTKITNLSYQPFYPNGINSDIEVLNDDATGKITIHKEIDGADNIISKMNSDPGLNGVGAINFLRKYIDDNYRNPSKNNIYTKRSELFLGGKAAYDVDELVALFRCVKLNPKLLTGTSKNIVPFFPRNNENSRSWDYFRFLQFFGVRGVESRQQWFYVDKDGNIVDTRYTEEFATGLEKLHQMYQEGLLLEDYDIVSNNQTNDFRAQLIGKKYDDTNTKQIGFATYDYNQTTTIYNDTNSELHLVSVLPAVADFDDGTDGNFIHYTESWRSVKTQGWFITKQTTGEKLDKALNLFNYLYSDEGNRLMSYGPDSYLEKDSDGKIKTIDYQGKQVPKLSDTTKEDLKKTTKGNYTNYYRYYLGGTFPVGYVKEQGMEYQTVSTSAQDSLNVINKAIQYGVLQHPNHKTDNTNHLNDIVPTTLPYTDAQNSTITSYTDLIKAFTTTKYKSMTINSVVKNGWGTYDTFDFGSKEQYMNTVKTSFKLDKYVELANEAYTRFKAL